MRFDTPVYFRINIKGEYNEKTGNYADGVPREFKRFADVTHSGAETMNIIYGKVKPGILTLRIQGHYNGPYDCIRIGSKCYRVDFERRLKNMHTFVVSEVQ